MLILDSAAAVQLTFKRNLLAYLVIMATTTPDLTLSEVTKILEVLNSALEKVKEPVVDAFLTDEVVEFIMQHISSSDEFTQVNGIYLKSYWYRLARTSIQKVVDKQTRIGRDDKLKTVKRVETSQMFRERAQEPGQVLSIEFTPSQIRLILFCFEHSAKKLMEIISNSGEDFFQMEVSEQ
jgi:hypothetical protein